MTILENFMRKHVLHDVSNGFLEMKFFPFPLAVPYNKQNSPFNHTLLHITFFENTYA